MIHYSNVMRIDIHTKTNIQKFCCIHVYMISLVKYHPSQEIFHP